jgi:WD40 repeat protein
MAELKPENIRAAWQLLFEGAWPMAVSFLGSHRRLAAANQEGVILVWDLPETPVAIKIKDDQGKEVDGFETPPPVRRLDGHTNGVTRLVATPDGNTLVSSSLDRTLRLWDLTDAPSGTGEIVIDRERRERRAKRVAADKRQEILDAPGVTVATQSPAVVLAGHRDWVNALGISRDGRRIISGDDSGLVIVWDIASRQEVSRWTCPGVAWVVATALSPDGQTALVSQYRRKGGDFNNYPAGLRLHNVADGKITLDILATLYPKEKNPPYQYQYEYSKFIAHGLVAVAFSPDGKLLAAGQGGEEGDGKIHLIETATGKVLRTVGGHKYGMTDVAFSNDGQYLFSTGRDTLVRVTRVEDGKEVAQIGKTRGGQFTDWLSALTLSPDEHWLAAADIAGLVQVWEFGNTVEPQPK